jgi:AcrR family transcriptional regulator
MRAVGLSRTAYFMAAFDLLADEGPDGLTIAALCGRLGVTKGSFYHHFLDFSEFVQALLEYWAAEHATRLIALSESVTDPFQRFDLLKGIAVTLPHGTEAAIRAWSWSNQQVADVQRVVDEARLAHLTQAGVDAGLELERSRLMAKISLSVLVGMQQLERPAPTETMDEVFSELKYWTLREASTTGSAKLPQT